MKYEIAIIVIAAVLVLLFGGKKIPELAKGIGQAGRELRKGFNGEDDDKKSDKDDKDDKKS